MVGYISDAVAKALKNWDALREADIIPVRSTEGDSIVVDTPLPAVVIHVRGDEGEGNTFFGGGIRQYFELELQALLPITNFTFSADGGKQGKMLDISDEVIRCIERTTLLDEVKANHDLNLQFDSMETETAYGTSGAMTVTIDVHKIVYKGSVEFDLYGKTKPTIDAELETVNIETENV